MSPKRHAARQVPSKTVTIYNSNNSAAKRERKMPGNAFEQTRNSAENWEFHFKLSEIETVIGHIKAKEIVGVPLIIGAAVLNQKETLMNLLKHGYNINEPDKNNITPLGWAVKLKHLEMIQALLENNADFTIKPQNGDDLASMAIGSPIWDEQSFLILFNSFKTFGTVDVNAINKNGLSLLHLAVRREWHTVIDVLIKNEVNVNITTTTGVTSLMLASYRNNFTIVTRLLHRGASVKRRNADGFTALCYAFCSAITKELTPPFLVVDRLQIELAKHKIDLTIYLKERVKLLLSHCKARHTDQPTPEQMLSNIVIFILTNVQNAFELFAEVSIGSVMREALDKYIDDKANLKLPLVVLNVICKHLSLTLKVQTLVITEFIDSGTFDVCLKVMRLYEDDPMFMQLAATPIIIFSKGYTVAQQWYESIKDEVGCFLTKYELCMDIIEGTPEQLQFISKRLEEFKYNICNMQRPNIGNSAIVMSEKELKSNSKKAKRRAKALKAKIAKLKNTELTGRYNIVKSGEMVKINEGDDLQNGNNYDTTSDEETLCANAIRMAMGILEDDSSIETSSNASSTHSRKHSKDRSRMFNTHSNIGTASNAKDSNKMFETGDNKTKDDGDKHSWQNIIRNLPFQGLKMYKPACGMSLSDFDSLRSNLQTADVDVIIKYLENLLGIIVSKYKEVWHHDKPSHCGSENEFDCVVPSLESDLENIQNMEKEQLRYVYREFYNLTRNVKEAHDNDPDACLKILKELEKFLLSHSIRGETIIANVADLEIVKVNVTMPVDYDQSLPLYMENVIAGETDDDSDIKIEFKEHLTQKTMDANSMGDYVYLNEIAHNHSQPSNLTPNQHHNTSVTHHPHINPLSHSYAHHVQRTQASSTPSTSVSSALNIWDVGDDLDQIPNQCCSYKGYNSLEYPDKDKGSKWSAMVRSLEMMDDSQSFLNGNIRLSNIEKRKSHLLSLNGNFSVLEIGLAADNKPVAVKILSKNDPYAILLKNQVEPLLKLRFKYILQYHTCKYENNLLIIATPLCEYNLGQYVLKMRHPQSQICKVNVIRQFLTGLMYLHNHDEPIVHGNLKPSNILIDINGTVKVAEFGIYKAKLKTKHQPESTVIWFSTELYNMYKKGLPLTCTCASDIQVAGMLVHFANNGGTHPFGRNVPDILKHLVEGTADMTVHDMDLYDLLSWMLMGEPGERPSIHQVLAHIFFWSKQKKWTYILLCAGFGMMSTIPMDVDKLHASLDKIAAKEKITGNCWVMTAKKQYPELSLSDASDTPSGLLRFVKDVVENNLVTASPERDKTFSAFILNTFPHFVLALYRMIENSEWSDHRVFLPFHNVMDY